MPRWCRIHFLLFAAQLDGLKITTSSNINTISKSFYYHEKSSPKNSRSPSFNPKAVFLFWLLCVKERNWSTLSRDRKEAEADHWRQVNRFLLDDEICPHNFTPHRTETCRVDGQQSRDERFSRLMSACTTHTHTKQPYTQNTLSQINFFLDDSPKLFLSFVGEQQHKKSEETSTTPDGWILRPVVLCCHCVCVCFSSPKLSTISQTIMKCFHQIE